MESWHISLEPNFWKVLENMSWFNTEMRGKWKAPTEHIWNKYNIVSKSSSLPAFNTRVQQKDFSDTKVKANCSAGQNLWQMDDVLTILDNFQKRTFVGKMANLWRKWVIYNQ